jgi:Na+-translocating ferredoxin:NAD+ oxidoreductase RnfG subunit
MLYSYIYYMKEEILKIAEAYQKTVKERIDQLLEMDATQYTNLGSDSTKAEKAEVKKNSKVIYKAIKDLDEYTGKLLLEHLDA